MGSDIVLGWHFLSPTGTAYNGYRPPAVGVWEPPIENPEPCVRGYHGSPTILKALQYATGPILGRCEYRGVVWHADGEKWAARERRGIARVDASAWLRFAACHLAEEACRVAAVTDAAAATAIRVAREFALGQATAEELTSARVSAWTSARAGARAGAWASAWDSAWESAWTSARAGARAGAWASAWASAWESARASARERARASAWAAEEAWLESAALDLDCAPAWEPRP